MKRARFHLLPSLITVTYMAILCTVGALSVHLYIAQIQQDSLRYQLGGFMDRLYPFVSIPIRPLGLLSMLRISIPAGFILPVVFLYIFLLSCIALSLVRRIFRHAFGVA